MAELTIERGIFLKDEHERENGRRVYWIRWSDVNGKQRRKRVIGGLEQARADLREAQGNKNPLPANLRTKKPQTSFAELVAIGLDYSKREGKKSYSFDVVYSKNIVKIFSADSSANVSGYELQLKIQARRKKDGSEYSGAAQNRLKSFLKMCYAAAMDHDRKVYTYAPSMHRFQHNPAADIDSQEEVEVKDFLGRGPGGEYERLHAIIAADYPEHLSRFEFALATGLRWSSQHSATYDMLDEHAGVLRLPDSKSGEPIHIPLNSHALAALRATPTYEHKTGFIFPNENGDLKRQAGPWFANAVEKAKIKHRMTWHSATRHSFVSWLVQDGLDLHTASKLAFHKSLTSTNRYAHLTAENLRQASERFSAVPASTTLAPKPLHKSQAA